MRPLTQDIWATIAEDAAEESALWRAALRPAEEREAGPVFSPLADEPFRLGLETIYEGYLLHYGRPRLFASGDRDSSILLGDYLYAHGLVRIADLGDVGAVGDLAELISLCAQLRAEDEDRESTRLADGAAWAATASALGGADGRLDAARAALRDQGDHGELHTLALAEAGADAVERALGLHGDRVD